MKDTFNCWLAVLMLACVFFGAALERSKTEEGYLAGMLGWLIAATFALFSLRSHYRAAMSAGDAKGASDE